MYWRRQAREEKLWRHYILADLFTRFILLRRRRPLPCRVQRVFCSCVHTSQHLYRNESTITSPSPFCRQCYYRITVVLLIGVMTLDVDIIRWVPILSAVRVACLYTFDVIYVLAKTEASSGARWEIIARTAKKKNRSRRRLRFTILYHLSTLQWHWL